MDGRRTDKLLGKEAVAITTTTAGNRRDRGGMIHKERSRGRRWRGEEATHPPRAAREVVAAPNRIRVGAMYCLMDSSY